MTEIYKKIKHFEKIIDFFGYWPSFYGAEVLSFNIERLEESEFDGPHVHVQLHMVKPESEPADKGQYKSLKTHCVVDLCFTNLVSIDLNFSGGQEPILNMDITTEMPADDQNDLFKVRFQSTAGIQCELICHSVVIASIRKGIPEFVFPGNNH
jgi:hypothetical protein